MDLIEGLNEKITNKIKRTLKNIRIGDTHLLYNLTINFLIFPEEQLP